MAQMNLSQNRNTLTDTENKLVAAKEVGDWEGWTRNSGLVDANYYI